MTALCNKKFSATQYALLSSLGAIPMNQLGAFSGFLAESVSWPTFYIFTTLAMIPALLVLMLIPSYAGLDPETEAATEGTTHPAPSPEAAAELAATAKKSTG
jgi:PAT family beta-lactamase induction signal transducer AmpG